MTFFTLAAIDSEIEEEMQTLKNLVGSVEI